MILIGYQCTLVTYICIFMCTQNECVYVSVHVSIGLSVKSSLSITLAADVNGFVPFFMFY